MVWVEVEIGEAPKSPGIYRFSSRVRNRIGRPMVVRYVGKTNELSTRVVRTHECYRSGNKVEINRISNSSQKFRRPAPEDGRQSITKLERELRMEFHRQLTNNPKSCHRNIKLHGWRNRWIGSGQKPFRRF